MQTLMTIPFSVRVENAIVAYAAYLEKTFVPRDLVVYYPHPGGAFSWLAIGTSAAVLLAVSGTAIAGVRRLPDFFVGWSWFLGTLVPMIGLVQVGSQQMADRYTYFPLIGLFIVLVWLIADFVPAGALRARLLPVATLGGLTVLAAMAFVQVGYWGDDLALFRHALEGAQDNPFTRNKIGAPSCSAVNCPRRSTSSSVRSVSARNGSIRDTTWVSSISSRGAWTTRPPATARCSRSTISTPSAQQPGGHPARPGRERRGETALPARCPNRPHARRARDEPSRRLAENG